MFYNIVAKPCLLTDSYRLNINNEVAAFSLKDHCKIFIQKLNIPIADVERFCCYSAANLYAGVFRRWAYRMKLDTVSDWECHRANMVREAFTESVEALIKREWFIPPSQSQEKQCIDRISTRFEHLIEASNQDRAAALVDFAIDKLNCLLLDKIEEKQGSIWTFNTDCTFMTLVRQHALARDNSGTINVGALFSAAESSRLPDLSDYPNDVCPLEPPKAEPYDTVTVSSSSESLLTKPSVTPVEAWPTPDMNGRIGEHMNHQ